MDGSYPDARTRTNASTARARWTGRDSGIAPVVHTGNQNESPEEVLLRIASLFSSLLREEVTGPTSKAEFAGSSSRIFWLWLLTARRYRPCQRRFPLELEWGLWTSCKVKEAPVVIYSRATSTPEDAPRGMEFLYILNRLNMAVSRARCVAVVVASPALSPGAVQNATPNRACQRVLPLPRDGPSGIGLP
jgi:uncharacterized protein